MSNEKIKEVISLKEMFSQVIDRTKDLEGELYRLYKIEESFLKELDVINKKIIGLEKSCGYSSISTDARNSIKEVSLVLKKQANDISINLGLGSIYEIK